MEVEISFGIYLNEYWKRGYIKIIRTKRWGKLISEKDNSEHRNENDGASVPNHGSECGSEHGSEERQGTATTLNTI